MQSMLSYGDDKFHIILNNGLRYGKTLNDAYLLCTYFLVSDSNYHTEIISYKNIKFFL